jgi:hypothetical protein
MQENAIIHVERGALCGRKVHIIGKRKGRLLMAVDFAAFISKCQRQAVSTMALRSSYLGFHPNSAQIRYEIPRSPQVKALSVFH